jgi:hypothetical protein
MTTRLPILENLRIASPCSADWDDMQGDERVRLCGKCEKNVYNLSALSRDDAERLVREREGRLCVRLYRRSDGTVLTADCPVAVERQRLRQRVWARVSGLAAAMALLLGVASGRARADLSGGDTKPAAPKPAAPKQQPVHVMMGPPPPAPQPKPQRKPKAKAQPAEDLGVMMVGGLG